jgi:hypothetical protein
MNRPTISTPVLQSTILTLLGAIGTAVASLVPAWGPDDKIIVAALGVVITAILPLVPLHARRSAAIENAATINAQSVTPILHISQAAMPSVLDTGAAAGLTAAQVDARVDERLKPLAAALAAVSPS